MMNKVGVILLAATCQACVQVELVSISNGGRITDTLTSSDEMEFIFGVGKLFIYDLSKTFQVNTELNLPPGLVSFPCFSNEPLWIQAIEHDDVKNDFA